MSEEHKFPSEIIDLPSKGKLYPKDSPLSEGKVEIKYMTAREEDILTSQNLIKKGIVIEKLLNSFRWTPSVINIQSIFKLLAPFISVLKLSPIAITFSFGPKHIL